MVRNYTAIRISKGIGKKYNYSYNHNYGNSYAIFFSNQRELPGILVNQWFSAILYHLYLIY